MIMYILDTDHLTILEQPGGPARQRLVAQLAKHPPEDVATTVITYEVIKIWKALGTRALEAFFGIRK